MQQVLDAWAAKVAKRRWETVLGILADVRSEPEPTVSELAEQVRTLRAEVQALREQQAPRSEIVAVGPEVTQLFFKRYATHGRSGL